MDDTQIKKYIESLPEALRNIIYDSVWENRTLEIGKKYSLTQEQIDILIEDVLLILIGADNPESFEENITEDLKISRLLSEQISKDVEERVLDYAIKELQSETRNPSTNTRIPEIKPNNLPAVEIGQESKPYSPVKSSEVIQKPYSVPRFGMKDLQPKVAVINLSQNKPATGQDVMENKLNSVTTNIPADMKKSGPITQTSEPKLPGTKYDADPYREPLS